VFLNNPLTRINIGSNINFICSHGYPSFPNRFEDFYYKNERKAGIYMLDNGQWSIEEGELVAEVPLLRNNASLMQHIYVSTVNTIQSNGTNTLPFWALIVIIGGIIVMTVVVVFIFVRQKT
jgi:hypothetical protein